MSNPFVWFDHRSDDPTGASGFYERLLGWTPAAQSPPGFKAFEQGERPWAGMAATEELPKGWLPYAQVENLESAISQATQLGGCVIKERTKGPGGTFAVVEDPAVGAIALWQAA